MGYCVLHGAYGGVYCVWLCLVNLCFLGLSLLGGVGMSLNTECSHFVLSMYLNSACCAAFPERRCDVDEALRPNFC